MASSPATAADTDRTASSTSISADFRVTQPEQGQRPAESHWDATEVDVASHEGLRHALESVLLEGWEGPAGRSIVAALQRRAGSWAFLSDRRCGRPAGATDPAEVIAVAWLTLEKFASRTVEAQRPWAYLWTAVGNELARAAVADSTLTDASRVRSTWLRPVGVDRVGLDCSTLDATLSSTTFMAGSVEQGEAMPSAAATELARRIAGDLGDIGFWLDAIDRALDVMADARRSYEEYVLRRDPYMRDVLGLSLDEISALAALLIGPRKGDRAAQSLLLALHRDPAALTASVVGASARISLLRSHRGPVVRQSAA